MRSARSEEAAPFYPLSQLRKMRNSVQVAAVCYRVNGKDIEFLLVQTGGGRWTFPKGSAEPGLTHAQAAALEAFEEAGVHGRIEEYSFTSYAHPRRTEKRSVKASGRNLAVHAHLCEVSRRRKPEESKRNPTWFSAAKAKRRLQEDRGKAEGGELARVVDDAVARIQRSRNDDALAALPDDVAIKPDSLQRVSFEATPVARYAAAMELALHAQFCELLTPGSEEVSSPVRISTIRAKKTLRQLTADRNELSRVVERFLGAAPGARENRSLPDKRSGIVIEIDKKLNH